MESAAVPETHLHTTRSNLGQDRQAPAVSVSTCGLRLNYKETFWTVLEIPGIEPTNNAAVGEAFSAGVWALRQAVIHRKVSRGLHLGGIGAAGRVAL